MPKYSRAKAYEDSAEKLLEQFLYKSRVDVGSSILGYLLDYENLDGVPQKRLINEVSKKFKYGKRRVLRTLKDLLVIGLVKDIGSTRTARIYVASPDYCGASLQNLAKKLKKIKQKAKKQEEVVQ